MCEANNNNHVLVWLEVGRLPQPAMFLQWSGTDKKQTMQRDTDLKAATGSVHTRKRRSKTHIHETRPEPVRGAGLRSELLPSSYSVKIHLEKIFYTCSVEIQIVGVKIHV